MKIYRIISYGNTDIPEYNLRDNSIPKLYGINKITLICNGLVTLEININND